MNTTREYVEVNFTEEEKLVFNFILNSFPESILVDDDGIENEDLLALLAVIAKAIGNSRELINNLTTAHSVEELINKVKNNELVKSNEELLLLLIEELDVKLFKGLTKDEKLDLLKDDDNNIKNLVLNSYPLTKDRGTSTAIKNIIDFTLYKTLEDKGIETTNITKQSTITNGNGQVVVALENQPPLEELIDFSFNNYNKIRDPLNPDYFIESANGYDMYNIDTDNITYKTLMNYRPAGIFYNILIEYISNKLFSNMTGDEVISHEEQLLTNNIIQLGTIEPPEITAITVYTDYDSEKEMAKYKCEISYENSNRFVPLTLNIDIIKTNSFPIAPQKEIPINQTKSGTVSISFELSTEYPIGDGQYKVKAYFNGDDTSSDEVYIMASDVKYLGEVPLSPPTVVELHNTLAITSSNNVPVGIEILETWTYNGSQYLTRKYLYDGLTSGGHMYHPILNPSTMYKLNLEYSVKFTFSSSVSPEYNDEINGIVSGTYAYQYPDVISNVEIVEHGGDDINKRYTPYVEVHNPNNNCLNYYIYQEYYEYLVDKDGPGQLIFGQIPSETPMIFENENIINPGETKKLYLPQSPLIDGSDVLGKYVIVFGHENTDTTIIETNNHNYIVIPSRQIIEEDLKPYTTILSKGKSGYQTDSYGYLNIKTSINPQNPQLQLYDTSKFSLACNFAINWKDPASGQSLGTSNIVVGPSGVNNNEFSVNYYPNPYNRTVNATVEPMIEIKVLANNRESHFVLQQETIENILNNYGGE